MSEIRDAVDPGAAKAAADLAEAENNAESSLAEMGAAWVAWLQVVGEVALALGSPGSAADIQFPRDDLEDPAPKVSEAVSALVDAVNRAAAADELQVAARKRLRDGAEGARETEDAAEPCPRCARELSVARGELASRGDLVCWSCYHSGRKFLWWIYEMEIIESG